jgi:translation initiation factor 1|tara:strand:+ start:22 stop:345 length:324 start_codon:yes stop_codon:yes gene_type:complete
MSINNLNILQDLDGTNDNQGNSQMVHIRIQSRTTRKSILTISGLDDDLDLKKICRFLKKNLRCNGAVVNNKQYGDVIQLQGDHREIVKQFLVDNDICLDNQIIIHGA